MNKITITDMLLP